MDKIRVDLRLRPIRFGFITRPDDGAKLKQIFQINTCLWGGKFNPIIPFFKRVPQWWDRHGPRGENATEIVNGYLDYFEPDFVVESEKGLASGLGINDKRVLRLSDVLMKEDDRNQAGHGLSVFDLYRDLYEKEFQFVQRHKQKFVMGKVKDRAYAAFAACLWGGFPSQQNLRYFERGFKEAFEAEDYVIEASSLAKLYRSGRSSALRLGHWNLDVNFHDYHDPTLFVLDATEPRDLVDFWNYRSIHREVLAFPVQWLNEMAEFGREVIRKGYRPLPGNPNGVMITPKVMFSRSIPAEKGEKLFLKHSRRGILSRSPCKLGIRRSGGLRRIILLGWIDPPSSWKVGTSICRSTWKIQISSSRRSLHVLRTGMPIGCVGRMSFDCVTGHTRTG